MKMILKTTALVFALASPAFSGGHMPLEVTDQAASTSVTIAAVTIDVPGFVTIHGSDADGNMIAPASLGHTFIEAGSHNDVVVDLATAVSSGTGLYAMLHIDDGQAQIYEFGVDSTDFDGPYIKDGGPIIVKFVVE